MTDLIISPEAEQDLVDIWVYIAEDSPVNADNYIDKLIEKAEVLANNSLIGVERNELAKGLRCFPVDHYILYYFPLDNTVELVRVLHASRDILAIER